MTSYSRDVKYFKILIIPKALNQFEVYVTTALDQGICHYYECRGFVVVVKESVTIYYTFNYLNPNCSRVIFWNISENEL